ncbi:MAG: hypothetical protein KF745_07085 [Phycisphaeraceae bacterium]|nr:hypothetical protein [Phycisphaeraceae bacterium]
MPKSNPARHLCVAAGALLSLTCLAHAQDSVITTGGLPGDALDAYRTSVPSMQEKDFVVDLQTVTSSWGGKYAIGPILKSSRSTSTGIVYFNHLIGAQAASNVFGYGPIIRPTYQAWRTAGQGVNTQFNSTPTDDGTGNYGTLSTAGLRVFRFGAAMMEFGGGPDTVFGNSDDENNIITGVVGVAVRRPTRLYVSRFVALSNRPSTAAGNIATASMGLGGVDDDGNVHVLADSQGLISSSRLLNKNLVRVNSALRDLTKVNQLLQGGSNATAADGPATQVVLETAANSSTTLSTPTIIPSSVAGRPVMLAADFASNMVYEPTAGTTATTRDHLPAPTGSVRGTMTFAATIFPRLANGTNDAGTGAALSRTDNNTTTRGICLFAVNKDGTVDSQQRISLPLSSSQIVDPTDGYSPGATFAPISAHEFTHYQSQVAFRGGNGQAAITVLPGGDLLAAATVAATGGGGSLPQSQDNYIAVARVSAATGDVAWTVAAHTGGASGSAGGLSKAIRGDFGLDGVPGTGDTGEGDGIVDATPIGRLALRSEVFPGSSSGPSISAPAMDRAGNLYFLSTVALNTTGGPLANKTVALLRANYNPGTGGYALEMLYKTGDVVFGLNGRRNYQVQFMGLADSDSADSGAVWSGNIVQDAFPGANPASAPFGSNATLGALVFRAKIVYDFNGDGQYVDPSAPGGSGSDQAYNVLMALVPFFKPGDFDRNGSVDPSDIAAFINTWFAALSGGTSPTADWDGNGSVEPSDIATFINDWLASL